MTGTRGQRIYFLGPVGGGPVKIGCSVLPLRRRDELQYWSPYPLEILTSAPGDMRDERRMHAHFRSSWSHGEWFKPTPELYALIHEVMGTGVLPAWVQHIVIKPRTHPGRKWTEAQRANARKIHGERWTEIKASRAASPEVCSFFERTKLDPYVIGDALGEYCSYVPKRVMIGGVCDIAKIEKLLAFIRGYDALQAPQGAA